jgi:preprotein translocase subunit SecG
MDQDILDKLATGEYSISPRSGRLRKRIKKKKKQSFFSSSRLKKLGAKLMWVLVILGFLISLILVFPELNIVSDNKKTNQEKNKQMRK